MKIYNEIILQWNEETQQLDTVYEDSFDYSGPMMWMANCPIAEENCICDPTETYCPTGGNNCWNSCSGTQGENNLGINPCACMGVPGCTDPEAPNYNPDATTSNGSCEYLYSNPNLGGWINDNYIDDLNYFIQIYRIRIFKLDVDGNIPNEDIPLYEEDFGCQFGNSGLCDENYMQDIKSFTRDGLLYEFPEIGNYLIRVTMWDTTEEEQISQYETDTTVYVSSVESVEQSLGNNLLPWQGIDVPADLENTQDKWYSYDTLERDGRPSLGCFYYDELNTSDYNFLYGENIVSAGGDNFKQINIC